VFKVLDQLLMFICKTQAGDAYVDLTSTFQCFHDMFKLLTIA